MEEIQLNDSRFRGTIPSNEEISRLYFIAATLVTRFAREIRNAGYESSQGRPLTGRQRTLLQLYDVRIVWQFIYEHTRGTSGEAGDQLIGIRDTDDNLQAVGLINLDYGGFVFVKHFGTAPENIVPTDETESVKGTGRSLMELIVRYGINQGVNGTVKLVPKERAVTFYTQLGFQWDDNNSDLLILNEQRALELLANQ